LSENINYELVKQQNGFSVKILSNSPYGAFQEGGFTPHYAPITPYVKRWLDAHQTGAEGHKPGKKGYIFVTKSTPHIEPAIETVRPNIESILKEGVGNILDKIGG